MKSGSFSSYRAALSGTGADIGGERDNPDPPQWPTRPGFYWARWMTAAATPATPTHRRRWGRCEVSDNPETLCECGHTRNYHAPDVLDGEAKMGIGHFCEFEYCECMDFVPAADQCEDYD